MDNETFRVFNVCKCAPFDEICFVTSSGTGNQVTVYNIFSIKQANVNSSKFHDLNKLILTSCKSDVLKTLLGSSILKRQALFQITQLNWQSWRHGQLSWEVQKVFIGENCFDAVNRENSYQNNEKAKGIWLPRYSVPEIGNIL